MELPLRIPENPEDDTTDSGAEEAPNRSEKLREEYYRDGTG
jgi:hypothetical protein